MDAPAGTDDDCRMDERGSVDPATDRLDAGSRLPNAQGDPTWTLGGRYRFELRRLEGAWRIAGLAMTTVWAAGNQQIMSLAAGSTTTTTQEPR